MVVIILEKVPPALRGTLTRWMIEPHPGVFVGHLSARVRDKLWERCLKAKRRGGVIQIWSTNNEQRFAIRMDSIEGREIVDWEGIQLIRLLPKEE